MSSENDAGQDGADAGQAATLDHDAVAQRAYEISQSDQAGAAEENWRRAQDELSAEPAKPAPKRRRKPPTGDTAK
jgi:hypothetical protein